MLLERNDKDVERQPTPFETFSAGRKGALTVLTFMKRHNDPYCIICSTQKGRRVYEKYSFEYDPDLFADLLSHVAYLRENLDGSGYLNRAMVLVRRMGKRIPI